MKKMKLRETQKEGSFDKIARGGISVEREFK